MAKSEITRRCSPPGSDGARRRRVALGAGAPLGRQRLARARRRPRGRVSYQRLLRGEGQPERRSSRPGRLERHAARGPGDLRTTARPSPVPVTRVVKNGSNARARVARSIPIPVSLTAISTRSTTTRVLIESTPPSGIAWTALIVRFSRAWRSRSASPSTHTLCAGARWRRRTLAPRMAAPRPERLGDQPRHVQGRGLQRQRPADGRRCRPRRRPDPRAAAR
jgi:hypothetical protein